MVDGNHRNVRFHTTRVMSARSIDFVKVTSHQILDYRNTDNHLIVSTGGAHFLM